MKMYTVLPLMLTSCDNHIWGWDGGYGAPDEVYLTRAAAEDARKALMLKDIEDNLVGRDGSYERQQWFRSYLVASMELDDIVETFQMVLGIPDMRQTVEDILAWQNQSIIDFTKVTSSDFFQLFDKLWIVWYDVAEVECLDFKVSDG